MARVHIDSHMFGEHWFQSILSDLITNPAVTFTYSSTKKLTSEISRVRQALTFYKQIGELKTKDGKSRREDVDDKSVSYHIDLLEKFACYVNCNHCDDSHIFALVYVKPTPYIFSMDARMAKCRDVLNKKVNKRYCRFIVISSTAIYGKHKVSMNK